MYIIQTKQYHRTHTIFAGQQGVTMVHMPPVNTYNQPMYNQPVVAIGVPVDGVPVDNGKLYL
jgi:hypothetical protein